MFGIRSKRWGDNLDFRNLFKLVFDLNLVYRRNRLGLQKSSPYSTTAANMARKTREPMLNMDILHNQINGTGLFR